MTGQGDHIESTVVRQFSGVQAVYVLGAFNNWSTVATPMRQRGEDVWEAVLPTASLGDLWFFVWHPGAVGGRLLPS